MWPWSPSGARSVGWGSRTKKVIHAAERNRPDVAARRDKWRTETAPRLDVRKLVFVDETWAKTNMTRTHGYPPKGQRLIDDAPHGHGQTATFVGALRVSGFMAPLVIDGAINGEWFRAYVEQVSVPELVRGDAVVTGDLGRHVSRTPTRRVARRSRPVTRSARRASRGRAAGAPRGRRTSAPPIIDRAPIR